MFLQKKENIMENIVRLTIKDLEDFLKSLAICFPGDYIKREDWIKFLEDKKLLFLL